MNPACDPESLGIGGIGDLFPKAEANEKIVDADRPETDCGGTGKAAEGCGAPIADFWAGGFSIWLSILSGAEECGVLVVESWKSAGCA